MSWFSLPLFAVTALVFRAVFDHVVGFVLVAFLVPFFARRSNGQSAPQGAMCPSHAVPAGAVCLRCGRFMCGDCTSERDDVVTCLECARVLPIHKASQRAGRIVGVLMMLSFVMRALPIGAALAVGEELRPERWFGVWLVAGILVAQPRAAPATSGQEVFGVWLGRSLSAGGVVVGALAPRLMPDFVKWAAKMLVV